MSQLAIPEHRFFQGENPREPTFFSRSTGSSQVRVLKVTPISPTPDFPIPMDPLMIKPIGILMFRLLDAVFKGKAQPFIENNGQLVFVNTPPMPKLVRDLGGETTTVEINNPKVRSIVDELFRLYPPQVKQICIASSLE